MALLFCDGCDAFAATAEIVSKWSTNTNMAVAATGGRYGGGALQNNASQTSCSVSRNVSIASGATFYIGFSYRIAASGIASTTGAAGTLLINGPPNTGSALLGMTSGGLLALQGGTATAVATGPVINDGAWHWVEASFLLNGASSSSTCYVDGVQVWTGTFTLQTARAITSLGFGGPNAFSGAGNTFVDDVLIWDTTGSTFNTFPIGPRRISTQVPTGAGASTQFTPLSGANWSAVAQTYANANSGANYVQDNGTGNTDLYAVGVMAYTPNSVINGVVVNTFAENPSGSGTNAVTPKLRSGGTPSIASGATRTLGSSYVNYQDFFATDASAAAWTVTSVNAAQPGVGD